MKYAGSYRQVEYYDYFDEIHFSKLSQALEYYEEKNGTKDGCLEIYDLKTQTFNGEKVNIEFYHKTLEKYPQLRLQFYQFEDLLHYIEKYIHSGDRYSFHLPADSYNLINSLTRYGASDIILDEPFLFDMDRIVNYIRYYNENCKIHIRPYLGKPGWMPNTESIMHHFWVLPQHIYLYEDYIDYVDIFADKIERERRLIEAYCIKHEYTNLLGPLVENCTYQDLKMSAGYVPLTLAERRLNCKQICLTRTPSICHQCDRCWSIMQHIAKDYAENVSQGKPSELLDNEIKI